MCAVSTKNEIEIFFCYAERLYLHHDGETKWKIIIKTKQFMLQKPLDEV